MSVCGNTGLSQAAFSPVIGLRVWTQTRNILPTCSRDCVEERSLFRRFPECHDIKVCKLPRCLCCLLCEEPFPFVYYNDRVSMGPLLPGPQMEVSIRCRRVHLLDNMIMRSDRYDQQVLISMWNMPFPQPVISLQCVTVINTISLEKNCDSFTDKQRQSSPPGAFACCKPERRLWTSDSPHFSSHCECITCRLN